MFVLGVWENPENVNVLDALLIAVIAMLIVFMTLIIVIVVTASVQKGTDYVSAKVAIHPRKENAIVATDEDARVAMLVASIEHHRETGKGSRVVSITQIQE